MTNQPLTVVQSADRNDAAPQLKLIKQLCTGGSCPTVYLTDRDTYVVQGYTVPAETAGLDVPAGEQLVEIPAALLAEALKAVS
ncbi:hypothetical protein [Actinoplanes sp. NPDC048796]|uniref:hypothetical protein n=1 Tax=unclassified Actinoplanes TaxID=2626549 RepID=UPI0033E1C721